MTPTLKRAALPGLAVALVAAFFVAPNALAGGGYADADRLTAAVRGAFVGYWRSGDRDLSPDLQALVDYWFRYHLAKGAIAALLLVVLGMLGVRLWRAFARSGGVRFAAAGAAVTALAVLALATVMANAQGAVAPFASLLPMVVDGPGDAALGDALAQVRERLGADDRSAPAVDVMIVDFARYHEAMVVIAAVVAAALAAASVLLWRRFVAVAPAERRARHVLGAFGALSAVLALAVVTVVVANTTVAADPAPALLAFFNGGW
ncbi:hypothetical protein [Dactylosporangium darangshiense]|uniref:Tat (Twin-arginine translocation) pathway signal sequence n=1 Tax=Dactylosporangium darangshiense TaxID=579108 RepID=A0ABP8DDK0_9ACTN